ncbi:MAG: phospholipase [Muribaculaceae bacterium]|uniref:Phospholipase n=1 Tax=Duncaniella dubosii TaxID=2518971 RepID=A0A4P7W1W8_9BACT|nr:phospholipase [Duncaniella dubosii]MBJ2191062.1 phospholipase [Muribaculaceae bacterium]MCX4284506.1 phospholipase [Duncaniella dubosii]QCD41772.1 phospholipase [Duncaniella dubosii]HBN62796.1 phospholipase [Porphyromonadaceae bacterium]
MTGTLIILAVTLVTGLILYLTHRPDKDDGSSEGINESSAGPEECCGLHAVCEKGLSADGTPVYYDDEELDRFAGRQPDEYSDEEEEEFREVLYTLLPADIYPWGVSLTQRNVALPSSLRDEWLLMVDDVVKNNNLKA